MRKTLQTYERLAAMRNLLVCPIAELQYTAESYF